MFSAQTEALVGEIIDRHRAGVPTSVIADDLHIGPGTVTRVLAAHGLYRLPVTAETAEAIRADYQQGMSQQQLARKYNIGAATAAAILVATGVEVRAPGRRGRPPWKPEPTSNEAYRAAV